MQHAWRKEEGCGDIGRAIGVVRTLNSSCAESNVWSWAVFDNTISPQSTTVQYWRFSLYMQKDLNKLVCMRRQDFGETEHETKRQ